MNNLLLVKHLLTSICLVISRIRNTRDHDKLILEIEDKEIDLCIKWVTFSFFRFLISSSHVFLQNVTNVLPPLRTVHKLSSGSNPPLIPGIFSSSDASQTWLPGRMSSPADPFFFFSILSNPISKMAPIHHASSSSAKPPVDWSSHCLQVPPPRPSAPALWSLFVPILPQINMPKEQYMCQLCANHGIFNQPKKGHKQKCPYRTCPWVVNLRPGTST